jgi:hypothetical protein
MELYLRFSIFVDGVVLNYVQSLSSPSKLYAGASFSFPAIHVLLLNHPVSCLYSSFETQSAPTLPHFSYFSYFPYSNFHLAIRYLLFFVQHFVYFSIFHVRALRTLKNKAPRTFFHISQTTRFVFQYRCPLLRSITTYTPILSCTCHCQMHAKRNFSISSLTFFVPNIIKVKSRTMRLTTHGKKSGRMRYTCILV